MANSKPQLVLGIDPGYDRLGYGLLDFSTPHRPKIITCGCWQTTKSDHILTRFANLQTDFSQFLTKYSPDLAGIETLIFARNTTTAMRVSEMRGLLLANLLQQQIPILELNPSQVKSVVTGNGRADKASVHKMVGLQTQLPAQKLLDDTIDAIAIAITAYHQA